MWRALGTEALLHRIEHHVANIAAADPA